MSAQNSRLDRSATGSVRRSVVKHTENAQRALQSPHPSDADVHQARKEIKKSRAALRLLRAVLPEATYRREDTALRSAASTLNPARDARVLVRALDSLCRRRVALGKDKAVGALARMLRRNQAQAQRQLRNRPELLAGARTTLRQVQLRSRRWRVGRQGWPLLGSALKRIYRAGRRAGRLAERRPDASTLHQWRKQVQYLWHGLRILRPLHSKPPSKLTGLARRLADYLGKEHDLALLQSSVVAFAQRRDPLNAALLAAIEQRRRSLRVKLMPLGKRLYAPKPRAMAARLRRCCARLHS
jgi:CHAD domain-containing protein